MEIIKIPRPKPIFLLLILTALPSTTEGFSRMSRKWIKMVKNCQKWPKTSFLTLK